MRALAPNNRLGFIAVPLTLLSLLTAVMIKFVFESFSFSEKRMLIIAGLYVALLCWLLLALRVSDLFFDSEFLYFKRGETLRSVPLKNIRSLHRTRTRFSFLGFGPYQYRIEFETKSGLRTANLWMIHDSEELRLFEEEVYRAKATTKNR